MPDGPKGERSVLNKSQGSSSHSSRSNGSVSSRRTSANSTRSQRRSPSPSDSPLTPEESPLARTSRKRIFTALESQGRAFDEARSNLSHSRTSSGESNIPVCLCQREPKIPRPRNAFILYRQHHQARVVAQHPGLANPEISKIIGEQWQKQPDQIKKQWKELAEAEKIRHQQQYPSYRYQPRQKGRRSSLISESPNSAVERAKCAKCGGRNILAPTVSNFNNADSVPPTPGLITTPIARTLPALKNLGLHSPAIRPPPYQNTTMTIPTHVHAEECDTLGSLSPGAKRRRPNNDHPGPGRVVPSHYRPATVGPATPHPYAQPSAAHPYPPAVGHVRRDSLPTPHGVVSPSTPMGPPPRPGPGYQQHRLSQGGHSLTLPPLQTNTANLKGAAGALVTGGSARSASEALHFGRKITVLAQIAPPVAVSVSERGPLIVVEGDDSTAARQLSEWLYETLRAGDDVAVKLFPSPDLGGHDTHKKPMSQYHLLAGEWVEKSDEIIQSLLYKPVQTPADTTMKDSAGTLDPAQSKRDLDENYDDDGETPTDQRGDKTTTSKTVADAVKDRRRSSGNDKMDVDKTPTARSAATTSPQDITASLSGGPKPVGIIGNFSLRATNYFACKIPISSNEIYGTQDHWNWTATQWRGVVGPDLTVYVRDSSLGESAKPAIEMSEEGNLFVVKRTRTEGDKWRLEVEPSALRRLGFEVGEWVRAFGEGKKGSQ